MVILQFIFHLIVILLILPDKESSFSCRKLLFWNICLWKFLKFLYFGLDKESTLPRN